MGYPRFSPYGVEDDNEITWPNFSPGSTDVSSPEIPQGVSTTTAPLPQQVLPPSISPDRITMQDRLKSLYDTESPAMQAYKAHLSTMPENNPGIMTRIGAGLSGAAAGFERPGSGFKVAQEQMNAPYERDMAAWNNKSKRLGEIANIEDKGAKEKVALIKQAAAEAKEAEREKASDAKEKSLDELRRKEIDNYTSLINSRNAKPDATVSVDQQNKAITAAARALNLESGGKYTPYINDDGTIKTPDDVGNFLGRWTGANEKTRGGLADFYKLTQQRADVILGKPKGTTPRNALPGSTGTKESTATSQPSSRIVATEGVPGSVTQDNEPAPPNKVKIKSPLNTMPVPQQPIIPPKVAPQPTLPPQQMAPQAQTPLPPPNIPAPVPQAAAPIAQAPPQPNIPPPQMQQQMAAPPMMASHGPVAPPMAPSHAPAPPVPNIPPPMPQQMPQGPPPEQMPAPRPFVGPRDFMGPMPQSNGPSPNVRPPSFGPQQPRPMNVSDKAITTLKNREVFKDKAYPDADGKLAVGYGMQTWQGQKVTAGMKVTQEQADAEFTRQMNAYYKPLIDRNLKVPVTQKQYDGLFSLAWNAPAAALKIIRRLNAGEKLTEKDFTASGTVMGKKNKELQSRRKTEAAGFVE